MTLTRRRDQRGERGAVAGVEALLFSVLILIAGAVVLVDVWDVLDNRAALDAATREYTRSFTEQRDRAAAHARGTAAAHASLRHRGLDPAQVELAVGLPLGFGPCAPVEVVARRRVPWVRAPFLDQAGETVVEVAQRELIDAHREVIADADFDPASTVCESG